MATTQDARDKNAEGLKLGQAGDHQGANAAFDEAIRLDPSEASFYLNRAEALEKLGMAEEAAADKETWDSITRKARQETLQRRIETTEAREVTVGKVRGWTLRTFHKNGTLSVHPSGITFRRGEGKPEVDIPAKDITRVRSDEWALPFQIREERLGSDRVAVEYRDQKGRKRTFRFNCVARSPLQSIVHGVVTIIPLVGWVVSMDAARVGIEDRNNLISRIQGIAEDAKRASS